MKKKRKQHSIRADEEIFKLAEKIASEEERSRNYILHRWLISGMSMEIKNAKKSDD